MCWLLTTYDLDFFLQEVLIAAKIVVLMVAVCTLPSPLPFLCYCPFPRGDFPSGKGGGADSVTASHLLQHKVNQLL